MRITFTDIKEKAAPAVSGMGLLILAIVSFIVALWVLMAIMRALMSAG